MRGHNIGAKTICNNWTDVRDVLQIYVFVWAKVFTRATFDYAEADGDNGVSGSPLAKKRRLAPG